LLIPTNVVVAADNDLPVLMPPVQEPGVIQTLGDGPFRIRAEIAWVRMSPDGKELFADHVNETVITVLDAVSGLPKQQLPFIGGSFSPDGRLLAGRSAQGPPRFGVWRWPERTAVWVRNGELGVLGCSKFSPDAKLLAIAGHIPQVRVGYRLTVVDAANGRERWHTDFDDSGGSSPGGLVWLKNDWIAVSYSETGGPSVRIFEAASGRRVAADSEILANSPDDAGLAGATLAPVLAIFNERGFEVVKRNATDQLESVFQDEPESYGPSLYFQSVDVSPDGRLLFVATRSYCRVYDIEKGALLQTIPLGSSSAYFSPDGTKVTSALHSQVTVLSTRDWKPLVSTPQPAHEHTIGQLAFSPDGKYLASNDGHVILLWDWQKGRGVARIPRPSSEFCLEHMVFHPKDTLLFAGDGETVSWWDYSQVPSNPAGAPADAPEPAHNEILHSNSPPDYVHSHRLSVNREGSKLLAVIDLDAAAIALGSNPREKGQGFWPLSLGSLGDGYWVDDIVLSLDGRRYQFVSGETLRSFDMEQHKQIGEWKIPDCNHTPGFSPDGHWFVTNSSGFIQNALVINAETGAVELALPLADAPDKQYSLMVDGKAWTADSSKLASAFHAQAPGFRVWDMMNGGQRLGTQQTSRGRLAAIALTPDGRHLAAANADGTIQIWDLGKAFAK
jgi:WD40 repeat protein